MLNCLLPTLSDIFNNQATEENGGAAQEQTGNKPHESERQYAELKANREWRGATAALEQLLLPLVDPFSTNEVRYEGLILSGPAPVLSHSTLASRLLTGIFTPEAFEGIAPVPFRLTAVADSPEVVTPLTQLPLFPNDPIAAEQFCLAFTPHFGLVMVLGQAQGVPTFQFSFEPTVIKQAWALLRSRLIITNHHQRQQLDALIDHFGPPVPDYRLVMEFSRQLLNHLPDVPVAEAKPRSSESQDEQTAKVVSSPQRSGWQTKSNRADLELLQALTHEVRTPLTTIRTLTRSLLKRTKLAPNVVKRLEMIDQECTEQINRMELIFRAAELETRPFEQQMQLTPISLENVFQQSIPCWKKQAQRRGVDLDVVLPQKLPTVVGDPGMLKQVLTGLMEKFTRSLPHGGQIRVQVTTAGNQLKLQFLPQCVPANPLKSLGHLLMFQPETGSLSLNLDVTKNLFHSMGGKLIVRQRPQQGEELTIFLPLVTSSQVDTQPDSVIQ